MATLDDAEQALIDAITTMAPRASQPKHLRNLAEAYAWLAAPAQPHGGSAED